MSNKMERYFRCSHGLMDSEDQQKKEIIKIYEEALDIVKAVAHIGIDWGYGKFELTQEHIDKAREIYEQKKGI